MLISGALMLWGCGGGGGGASDDLVSAFNERNINLYKEVPVIEIQGNEGRDFNPKTSRSSGLYDSDKDGIKDKPINSFQSVANAANNMLDIEIAACISFPGSKQTGYTDSAAWVDASLFPDTMPAAADATGTKGTQFVQLIVPFVVDPGSVFDISRPELDYLNPDFITIETQDGDGTGDPGEHVFCTAIVNGVDVNGQGPKGAVNPYLDAELEMAGVNFDPGKGKSSIVFMAQPGPGITSVLPDDQPFALWGSGDVEIHIRLKKVGNSSGKILSLDARWYVLREGGSPTPISVEKIYASTPLKNKNGSDIIDPEGGFTTVLTDTNFIIEFSKPVIPETVGQSIVFGGVPFNGNSEPIPTSLAINPLPPSQNPCAASGTYYDPIAPNVIITSTLVLPDLTETGVTGLIPFRVYPLSQNNLCTYVLNPILDLPGSTDLGNPPFNDPLTVPPTRIRVTVGTFIHDTNELTGAATQGAPAVNMGLAGLFALNTEVNTAASEETFTVTSGGRYVNAPVSPNALYYTMGPKGLGVVDLDGNGFTTNAPDFSKIALVTSQKFYTRFGNNGQGNGNNYSYAAKATLQPDGTSTHVGLGSSTPMPGINEGSTGIDEIVRDSNGSPVLSPDLSAGEKFFNYTDVDVGDFLDTIFFDGGNEWAHPSFHLSAINIQATGNWKNNLIATPPTPNPPPLTVPVGMRPTDVIYDEMALSQEGAFVIQGKEVFTVDLVGLAVGFAPNTGFVHLEPAQFAGEPNDEAFPPLRSSWPGTNPLPDYMNLGPVADSSTIGMGWFYGSRQQIGNFLFVADKDNNQVRVLNSNTMEQITVLTGLNGPDNCAVSADLSRLYVTNSGGGTVTVFNVNPRSDGFLYPITNVPVGSNPKGVCCQPDLDDVLVCNFGSNTMSIINPLTNTVRKTVSSLLNKPWDLVAAPRQFTGLGFYTGVYHAYISNFGGNNVVIFESGPDGVGGVGYDDILDPVPPTGENGQQFLPIQGPRGLCYDPGYNSSNYLAGGVFVAHQSGSYAVVSRVQFVSQQAPLGPIFLIPNAGSIGGTPGFGARQFLIVAQWGGPGSPLSGLAAADVALMDYNRERWNDQNWLSSFFVTNLGDVGGSPYLYMPINNKSPIRLVTGAINPTVIPDRMFVSFQFSPVIDVIDPATSTVVKTITGLPGAAKVLKTYFKF